jgi:phospholipase C
VGNPLYKGIANTMPDGGLLQAFKDDIARGALPQVSYIAAPEAYCEHGDPSSPIQGGWYMEQVLNALTERPDIWQHTVLIVNYDENDGFFDHAVHPAAPSYNPDGSFAGKSTLSTQEEYAGRFVVGLGARVPATIVSPWSRGGWVNSQVFDHTSIIRFLERCSGVEEPSISAYRRAICGDLTSCFDFASAPAVVPRGLISPNKATVDALRSAQEALRAIPVPSVENQVPPRQENGIRPSRALPYQLRATSEVRADRHEIDVTFGNAGTEAAVFHVYDNLRLDLVPRRYTVEAGKTVQDTWTIPVIGAHALNDSQHSQQCAMYDLWMLGPNGFHRAFRGAIRNDINTVAETEVIYLPAENALKLLLHNRGVTPVAFSVTANAYLHHGIWRQVTRPNEIQSLQWTISGSGNWYDFTVRIDEDARFVRRFAGRMENGGPSTSDPAS